MKNKIKGLLALVLSVLIGQVWAADPVATWTDMSTLTSGDYTLNENGNTISDGVLTIGSKPSYIAGITTWDPRADGAALVLAMRVTNLDLAKVSALVSLKLGAKDNQLGLMTDGEGGMDAMWESNIRSGNNAVSTKLSTTATEYLIVFKYDNSGTYAWAIGNDGIFANYTKDTGCKGGTNEAGGDIRIGALYGAGSPATGLQIHSMWLWNTNESIDDVIATCATEEMKTNRTFVENGTGAQYTATVAENVNLSEIVWTKVADDTTVTTANLPNGAKLKIDASNNPVITSDVVFANKLIYTANPLTVTAAITPNQNDYSAIIPGIVSNPSYEIFPAGLFVGPGAVTYTATLNAPAGYEVVVAGNRATLKTVDSATLGIPSFGVNFYNGDAAKVAGTEAQGAYPIKGAAWTDVQGQSSAAVNSFNLADAAGNIIPNTTMSLERTQGARQWGLNNMPSSALLKGYIDDSNGNPTTLTFSNIPYAQYRVIVYMSTDTANYNFAPVSIGGISYASAAGATATATVMSSSNWGHTGPDHNANDLAEGVNYLVSPMMTSDSCVISTVRKANPRATIAAVQFIDCTAANRTMTLPGQEITLDANTKISDIDLTATEVLITVKPGVTLTFDEAVTLDSLRVVAEGTAESPVKFDATVANPFANIDSVSLEGTAVELVADIYVDAKPNRATLDVIAIASNAAATAEDPQEVASAIAIASGKTLKTKGYLSFTAANTIAGTLEVVSGETTFNLAQTGFSGTVKVATGATFKNGTNDGPNYNGSPVLDIAGTLEVTGNARWSLPQGTTTTLRDGAVLKGSGGEGYNYAYDYFAGATINVEGNAEIIGNIGAHNGNKIIFNVAEGKVLTLSGKYDGAVYSGSSSLEVTGSGTLKLTNSDNNYSGSTVIGESATLEVAGGSIGNSQLSGTGALNVTGGELNLSNANGNYAGVITIAEGATLKTASQHYNPFGTGTSIVNNGAIVVASTAESSISAAISGSGSLSVKSGTLTLSGANTYKGVTVIDQGAKVVANTTNGATWNFNNVSTEPDVTVSGELEILATGEIYRGFAGTGTISVKGNVLIGNTGNRGEVSGLSRFAGTLIVDVDKTLTLITWGNPYNIVLDSLVLNGTINGQSRGAGGSTLSVTTDNLSGSGSVNIPVTLADGATLAGAVTVTGDVTIAGALTITHATAAGDTVITCANADAVASALTGAPEGLKYVAENGAVKLAVAKKTNFVVTVGENAVNCETFAEALNVLGSAGGSLQIADDADEAALAITEPIVITADAVIDLNGKTITGAAYPVIRIQNGANVTIKNGTITNNDYVFVLGASDQTSAGNLTIESGTYTGVTTLASVTKGTLTITGGTFSVSEVDYGATYLLNCVDANYKAGTATIVVTGGTFNGFNPADNAAEGPNTNFCADGYTATEGEDGYWTVALIPVSNNVAMIGETGYETLQAACNDANEGDIVVLIADTEENCVVNEGFNGTIDLGGKTLTGRIFSTSATMTIQNGTIVRKRMGTDTSSSNGAIEIQGGSLTLQDTLSVQILATDVTHLIRLRNSASCVINGGNYSITSTGTDAALLYPSAPGTTMTVNGGTFTYDTTNASMPSIANVYGTLTVNGGTFNAYGQSYLFNIDNDGGKTYVKNGLFNCSSSGRLTYNNPKQGDPYGYLEFSGGKYACNPETTRAVIAEGYASGLLEDNYYIVSKAYAVGLTVDTAKATVDGLNEVHACGSIVSFTVTANEGFKVTSVKLGTEELTAVDGNYTFKMPAEAVTITVTTEAASTFDVMINGQPVADADALKLAANSTTTMTVPEGKWTAEGNILKKDGEAYVEFADYYTVVVNGTSVTLKLNKPVIGDSAEGADDAFTVTADKVAIKISNFKSALKYGVRTAADINGLKTAEITEVETEDGVITLTKSGDSAFYEVVVSDVDFPATPAE